MSARNRFFILLSIIFVISLIYYIFSADHSKDLVLIGTVDSNQVIVSAQVEGRIQKLLVDEGTPVKAAEDGVVAYSGNELKGYGNLVLIRHSNGYVTAYAHASEILVKRGDTIKRGQVIAKSGQSGEVASPQLHFEIRKNSTPVDPLQFLNGA